MSCCLESPHPCVDVSICTCACAACPASCSPLPEAADSVAFADPQALFRRLARDRALTRSIASECLAYALANGLTMLQHPPLTQPSAQQAIGAAEAELEAELEAPRIVHAPVTLLPCRLPASIFHSLRSLTTDFNALYEAVARDDAWLRSVLAEAAVNDPFLSRLLAVLEETSQAPGARQTMHLAINRSDYLMHASEEEEVVEEAGTGGEQAEGHSRLRPLQVEFNTISAGAGSLSDKACAMHRFLLERYCNTISPPLQLDLPPNPVIDNLTAAMAHAHRLFLQQQAASPAPPIAHTTILFVVQPREANMSDQRLLEFALWSSYAIPVVRMTLAEVHQFAALDEHHRLLLRPGSAAAASQQLVSLAYFRAGYTPRDFPGDLAGRTPEWSALAMIERSVAVKCPRLAYHLAGTKKVQQVLAQPTQVERLLASIGCPNASGVARRIRSVFAGLWQPTRETVAMALARPDQFVLKPQREGGGNNLWGEQMVRALTASTLDQLQQFVLMSRIRPPKEATDEQAAGGYSLESRPALKFGKGVMVQRALSELGMMGVMLSSTEASCPPPAFCPAACGLSSPPPRTCLTVHRNEFAGYLLRTKDALLNEGGLMSGAGAIDTLVLVP